jgi:translation elongation factor EF-4
VEDVIGIDADRRHPPARAKTGMGIDEILEAVIERMPARVATPTVRRAR